MKQRIKWTYEKIHTEALKYNNRNSFKKESPKAYGAARGRKIMDEVCSHMNAKQTSWTNELIQTEALKYSNRNSFKIGSKGAYTYALRNKILNEVCTHMPTNKSKKYSNEDVLLIALRYETPVSFQKNNPNMYAVAQRNGILNIVCEHMNRTCVEHTEESISKIAKNFKTRGDFANLSKNEYQMAIKFNILDKVCSHMIKGSAGDYDAMYLWVIPNTNIYKIGVTSKRLGDERIIKVAKAMGVDYEIIGTYDVSNALKIEKELHNTYQIRPTTLPKNDGYTEFRILTESDVNEITYYLENVVGVKI